MTDDIGEWVLSYTDGVSLGESEFDVKHIGVRNNIGGGIEGLADAKVTPIVGLEGAIGKMEFIGMSSLEAAGS